MVTAYGYMMNFCEQQNIFNVRASNYAEDRKVLPTQIDSYDLASDTNSPEELLIKKEEEDMLDDTVMHFTNDLTATEQLVFFACIYVENPTSVRDVALKSGMSKSTVGRIKKDLEERWGRYINEQEH
jgi:hypothetical protein